MRLNIPVLAIAAVTAIHPAWLELLGLDPDRGSGSFETLLVITCALIMVANTARLITKRQ